jgi:hypothetical protein
MPQVYIIKNLAEFDKLSLKVSEQIHDDLDDHSAFWDKEMLTRQGRRPYFQLPTYDFRGARKFLKLALEAPSATYKAYLMDRVCEALTTGPNDSHMGDIVISLK